MVLRLHHPPLTQIILKSLMTMTLLHQPMRLLKLPLDRLKTLSMLINFNLVKKCTTIRNFKIYSTKRKNLHNSNRLANDADKLGTINLIVTLQSTRSSIARYANILENDNQCIVDMSIFPLSHFEECEGTYRMMIRTRCWKTRITPI